MKDYETILKTKAQAKAFGRSCQCKLCKPVKCGGDITHVTSSDIYLCWICAREHSEMGIKVFEIVY